MEKLSALDAMFLYNETPATPMHVGSVQYLEVREDRRERFFDDLGAMLLDRIHLVPYLTNRVEFTPLGIDHPVWLRHRSFDIGQHLKRLVLPAPGDQATLDRVVAELYEPLMDRSRPLWEFWVIEGLASGQVALFQKIHHAAIDGMSSIKATELLYDYTDEPRQVEPVPDDFWRQEQPSPGMLLEAAFRNLTRYWWENVIRMPSMLQAFAQLNARYLRGERTPMPMNAPKTRLNSSIDAKRAFANVPMSLPVIKSIAKATGVKVNDVVLAVCGDGLAQYLAVHGERLDASLVAGCPVSLHQPGDTRIGNQVSTINVDMFNGIAEGRQRLRAIHASANNAKSTLADVRDVIATDFGGFGMPALLQQLAQAGQSGLMADLAGQIPMNLVVSNVPGFQVPLYVAGAKLIYQMPMSIVVHGSAVNLTVTSYVDRLDLGVTAASKRIPDVDVLRDKLLEAYQALADDVLGHSEEGLLQAA